MYFLLDTNILIDYIKDGKDDYFIEQINMLAEEGVIKILVPDILRTEWNEKKQKTLEFISNALNTAAVITKSDVTRKASDRVKFIDDLFSDCINIKISQKVKAATMDRAVAHKAPFHGAKTRTINDALIFFSTIDYLKKNQISSFVFITKDSGDFGSPENKNEVLHPELEDPQITILYFTSLYKCFNKLKEELKLKQPEKEGAYQLIITKKKPKNILDHLYVVIRLYKSKIDFLPTFLLSKIEPFRVRDLRYDYSYHSGSTLYTNNKSLIEFLSHIDIKKMKFKKSSEFSNSKNNLEKLQYIITALNENFVFTISHVADNKPIDILKEFNSNCSCAVCTYSRLSIDNLLNNIYNEPDELKRAFILFQIGRFDESLIIFHNIYQNAIVENNNSVAYRTLLVLKWIAQFAEYQISRNGDKTLINKINAIDLEKSFLSALTGDKLDKEIALFFHNGASIDYYKITIKEVVEKIREHYQSQLRHSYSSNSNLKNLLNDFLNFEMFIEHNGLAYTRYLDFKNICIDFTEGIFLSIALNEYQSSKIEHLDDLILERLLFYSDADTMIRFFNRYIKKQIQYQSEEKNFEKTARNFLNTNKETVEYIASIGYYEGNSFFYKIFWNLILLISIVDFDKDFILKCADKIFIFLESLPKHETNQIHHIALLIHSKGHILKKEILQPLIKFIIANPNFHNDDVFHALLGINNYRFKIDFTISEFKQLCDLTLNKCEKCNKYHCKLPLF